MQSHNALELRLTSIKLANILGLEPDPSLREDRRESLATPLLTPGITPFLSTPFKPVTQPTTPLKIYQDGIPLTPGVFETRNTIS